MGLRQYLRWRWDMLRHWNRIFDLIPDNARMVEVGTWRGASARRWLRRAGLTLYMVDPYTCKHDDSWEGVSPGVVQAASRAARFAVGWEVAAGRAAFLRLFSTDAAKHFPDASLDVVYIDGDHEREAVAADLAAWWPKLRPGGVIIGDDHITGRWWGSGVIDAVGAFRPLDESRRAVWGRWFVIWKAGDLPPLPAPTPSRMAQALEAGHV